jgi:uncharacterized RDD family membrane protein YckC
MDLCFGVMVLSHENLPNELAQSGSEFQVEEVVVVPPTRYATFTRRLRALLMDSAIIMSTIVIAALGAQVAGDIPGTGLAAWGLIFLAAFVYEPYMIWRRGATIGHAANQLIVVSNRNGQPPGFGTAFVRYVIKALMGVFSLMTIWLTRKHQAVHDMMTGTTVQLAPAFEADSRDFYVERNPDEYVLPSRLRRMAVTFVYLFTILIVYISVAGGTVSLACIEHRVCGDGEELWMTVLSCAWTIIAVTTIVVGWKGLLPGARRRRALSAPTSF